MEIRCAAGRGSVRGKNSLDWNYECVVDHTAIVRGYFSLIPIILQVRLTQFDVFLPEREFGASL